MKTIDKFLNNITMYRLLLNGLMILALIAIILGFLGQIPQYTGPSLPYSGLSLLISALILLIVSHFANLLIAKLFKAQANIESSYITALILFCIITPPTSLTEAIIVAFIAILAMASKYFLAAQKKHLFNPAAIAAVIAGLSGQMIFIWWIGSGVLLPFTLILGLLVVRKLRRFNLFLAFVLTSLVTMIAFSVKNSVPINSMWSDVILPLIVSGPLVFFGTIMLIEPLTTPPTKKLQIIYGILVGFLASAQFQFALGSVIISPSPELALVLGNIFAYIVSSKQRLQLTLASHTKLSDAIHQFTFSTTQPLRFKAGQYLEWTLPHAKPDTRGIRRYFTVASAPTEKEIHLGVRISPEGSSFKKALLDLKPGAMLTAGSLSGDFTLPQDTTVPLAFIAGGIGITPFRSQIQYLIDTNQKRDIVVFYAAMTEADFVYTDIFKNAESTVGLKLIPLITDPTKAPAGWTGQTGYITEDMLKKVVPNYQNRMWYLSGPNSMVTAYKKMLRAAQVPNKMIMTDYFPGF